jgi:fructokinase
VSAATFPEFVSVGEALTDMIRAEGDTWHARSGGSCWNVARAAASQDLRAAFAGCVSRDCFGEALARETQAAGLDMRFLQQADAPPLLAIVPEAHPPQYFFLGNGAADLAFDADTLPAGWIDALSWAHFGGIALARPGLADRLLALAEKLHSRGVKISYDPNYRNLMDVGYDLFLMRLTATADLMKVSDEDLRGLYRSDDIAASLAKLVKDRRGKPLLYTEGAKGSTLFADGRVWECPAPEIEVVDTVGAGDACLAGTVASLIRHPADGWPQHLARAVASGSAACMHAGATPPTSREVGELAARLKVQQIGA